MSVTCEHCRGQMLDFLYGLLDPAEEAVVAAHVADCPVCTAARDEAAGMKGLFATAAKVPFPEVKFVIPADATPAAVRPKPSRRLQWAIAASLLVCSFGLMTPALRDYLAYREQSTAVAQATARVAEIEKDDATRRDAQDRLVEELNRKIAVTGESLQAKLKTWVSAEVRASAQPFRLTVTGPVAAVPGAMNEYTFDVKDAPTAKVTAIVRDSRGTVFHQETLKPGEAKWRLPTSLWAKFPAGAADIVLAVSATNAAGATAELAEPIQLLAPVFTTLVVTDKPLYRPGESVYFRSLTLNGTGLQPPARDLTIRFELRKPDGTTMENGVLTGTTQPVTVQGGHPKPVVGPDGSPVRGIASGVFALPETLPGGEYKLLAFEIPSGWASKDLPKGALPIATRAFTVAKYQPEVLQKTLEFDAKSYGPGDTVRAKLTVKNQGKPLANIPILVTVTPKVSGLKYPFTLKADGTADIEFKLPNGDLKNPTLTVNINDQNAESIVRPVPLATKKVSVEFFPEGGDLIEGVPNRVYVRATTSTGKPADIVGTITDGSRTICDVKTLTNADHPGANQGLGVFTLTPEAGKRYALKLLRPVGTEEPAITVPQLAAVGTGYLLPKAEADGVALSIPVGVIDANQPLKATVTAKSKRSLIVGVYTRGLVIGHQRLTADPGKPIEVVIAPPPVAIGGVTRVTVFEEPAANAGRTDLVPLAERLVFRRPTEKLNLSFTQDRAGPYSPGDRVTLAVKATNENDQPTAAILLAAVVNQSVLAMADDKAERLLPTHFLLAGELQRPEQLEHADFLLTHHPKAAETLDLLLGTQGWRRFAEADGRFRSTSVSDAEQKRFWIATGHLDPVGEARPDRVTANHHSAVDPIDAKLDHLEAEKRIAETERDRKSPEWAEQARRLAAARTTETNLVHRSGERLYYGLTGILILALLAAAVWNGRRRRFGVRETLVILAILSTVYFVLMPAYQTSRSRGDDDGAVTPLEPPPTVPRPTPDLREGEKPNPRAVARVMMAPSPSRTDIGPGSSRKAAVDVRPAQLQADHADRAARTFKEGGPSPQEEAAFNDRVKTALTRHSPFVVREYAHLPQKADVHDSTRTDFTETVLWHPVLVLPGDGRTTLGFHVSDAINAYRVLVAGHTLDGRLGATTGLIEVQKPLAVDVKLPPEISSSDRPLLPIVVSNGTAKNLDAKVNYWSDYLVADEGESTTSVPAAAGARVIAKVKPVGPGKARVRVSATGDGHADAVERTVTVVPDGFPVAGSANTELKGTAKATLVVPPNLIPGTLKVQLQVFTNSFADIESGLDGLLREPHGCFEQTSSSNYPNVLALQYLKNADLREGKFVERALGLLERGYGRLNSFEVRKQTGDGREGFEWFGAFPAHECLTAYGLVQFADMARVFPVEPQVMERTRNFLLSRRDGKGGFTRKADAHAFGDVPTAVADAYLTWALSAADPKADLSLEAKAVADEALKSGDPYRLALAANVSPTPELLRALADKQKPDGSLPGAETSITRSRGSDLVVETTALAALAWQTSKSPDVAVDLGNAVGFLVKSRQPGGTFGGTQATVLALKAIVAYNQANRRTAESGEIIVRVGGKEAGRLAFKSDDLRPTVLTFEDAEKLFPPGEHEVTLETTAVQSYPVSVTSAAFSRTFASAADAPLKLTTTLAEKDVAEGSTVRLNVQLQNLDAKDTGMAVAIIGLPAGLKLPPDFAQLKNLTAKPQTGEAAVSYWEQNGRELVLYWRGLGPKQIVDLSLDLIADIPGEFHGPASRAYLYYDAAAKHWLDPLTITIRPKK
ncbi:alpha-2-macroglobulin family protein [Limnoglobus roseus]|uniref:Alpha-2-macroglobulin n=1 Tax=Limnoglobus roseus TaxID=2598579 RepID=A0A5C1ADD9_9BACT|nr:alpha-2-macroglobulin family protein [Limnoglobus roseus]QEL16016.1 alpha-2-macroglobulin [Limnoglobus roseus]